MRIIDKKILKQLYDFSTDDTVIYWWYALRNHIINEQAWKENNWYYSQTIFWLKNSLIFSHGQLYH